MWLITENRMRDNILTNLLMSYSRCYNEDVYFRYLTPKYWKWVCYYLSKSHMWQRVNKEKFSSKNKIFFDHFNDYIHTPVIITISIIFRCIMVFYLYVYMCIRHMVFEYNYFRYLFTLSFQKSQILGRTKKKKR